MRTVYVTFGQSHLHRIDNLVFDKDTVARIDVQSDTVPSPREVARSLFGDKYSVAVIDTNWNLAGIKFFPKGYVDLEVNL